MDLYVSNEVYTKRGRIVGRSFERLVPITTKGTEVSETTEEKY